MKCNVNQSSKWNSGNWVYTSSSQSEGGVDFNCSGNSNMRSAGHKTE